MEFPRESPFARDAAGGGAPPSDEAALAAFVARTTAALAGCVDGDGCLAVAGGGIASGAPWAALALALRELGDDRWRTLIMEWSRGPATRRRPTDRLALILLRDVLQRRSALAGDDAEILRRAIAKRVAPRRGAPNHEVLMAETAALLLAADGAARTAAARRLDRLCERWTTRAGGFVDAPARPGSVSPTGTVPQTPLDSHALMLLALVLVSLGAPEAEQPERLARGLGWLLAFADEGARAGGFGRAGHTLVGYATMLALFAYGKQSAPDKISRRRWALGAEQVRALLEERRLPDDLLGPDLGPDPGAEQLSPLALEGNAWAAGLLAWVLAVGPGPGATALPTPDPGRLGMRPEQLAHDEDAGLVALRGPRGLALLSLSGQPVTAPGGLLGSPDDVVRPADRAELRGAGVGAFHLVLDGRARFAPPMRLPFDDLARHPSLAGQVPVVRRGGRLHALMAGEDIALHADGSRAVIAGRVMPVVLGSSGHRPRASRIGGHDAWRAFVVDAEDGWCASVLVLGGAESTARLLNPHGRALLEAGTRLPLRLLRWREGDGESRPPVEPAEQTTWPGPLGTAHAACEQALDWPTDRLALITVLGPSGVAEGDEPPVRYDGAARRLVLPWASVPLGDTPA